MSLISYVTKIHFADGIVEEALRAEIEALGSKRPLIVTDRITADADILGRVEQAIPESVQCEIYHDAPGTPTEEAALAVAELCRAHGCDALIGLGGGPSLDLAKIAGVLISHDGPLSRYATVEGGFARIRDVLPPLIAIPTTAGNGSEVGRMAVAILDDGRAVGLRSPYLVPGVAISDPTLTVDLSADLTAVSGMDAITHCVETYISTAYNPPADGIALDGLRRAVSNIERAVDRGRDLEARREMMAAAMNGALAFQKGLGGVHAISHALGGMRGYALDHGAINGVMLPHMLEFNAPAVGHRYRALNEAMGLEDRADLPAALSKLRERMGLPGRLAGLGVDETAIEHAAPLAAEDYTNSTNPRRARAADYRGIMFSAL